MLKQRVGADLVILLCFCFTLQSISQKTHPLEVRALLAVQRKLVDPMNHLASWNRGDPCTSNWTGVLCFSGTDNYFHIRNLHLLNMNLSGVLSPGIGQLSHLRILDFMWNDLTGTIPREIGYMTSLELLLLNGNKLSGPLPDELGYLSNLNRLQVDLNQISGPIPKSFANMTSVKHLHMNNNSLSGEVPSELSRLPSLLHLLVDNNNLSGNLPPEFSNFPELRILQLDNNNFRGEIPVIYGNFTALVKLSLRNCSLEGPIRDLSTIQNLSYLDLSWNRFSGPIPSNKLSENVTTIDLSYNNLNGSIPESFSDLPFLQRLSLKNNSLAGSVSAKLWKNMSFTTNATLQIDLRNNLFSNILGDLIPPANVSLRLAGNPICKLLSVENSGQFCGPESEEDELHENSLKSNPICHVESCPVDAFFEYVVASPASCFCALPLRIGYRLKSPSFSYFPPYQHLFEQYVTDFLKLNLYQLSIGSYVWEGCRLTMYLKIFPPFNLGISVFNKTEEKRIIEIYTSWTFPQTDLFGPYELLNYTALDPFSNSNTTVSFVTRKARIGGGILAAIMLGAIVCVGLIAALIIFVRRGRVKNQHSLSRKSQSSKIGMKIDGVKSFTLKEMVLATGNFKSSSQVGQGGYGKVYRGILWDNSTVAIKRAAEGSLQGTKEFFTEIELLSRLHHRNLVSLIGYCDEDEEQMLVYEFMSNGTLRSWLSGKSEENLSFGMRLQIALGSAKGILYLHSEANPPIFHRDIKATNILLDDRLNAKVADFGLSRLAPVLDDEGFVPRYISTVVKGTPGYLDPEYFLTHKLTDKSDVYSLGVVFLEILTGMQPISHGKNIVREVNMAHQMGTMFSIIDSRMGSFPSECVEKFVALALACCHDKPEERPCMLDVVRELENIAKMMPEDGSTFFSSECSQSIVYNTGSNLASASTSASGLESLLSKDPSISISGSDLVSGVEPTINPR